MIFKNTNEIFINNNIMSLYSFQLHFPINKGNT